jgi:hypothetical protein
MQRGEGVSDGRIRDGKLKDGKLRDELIGTEKSEMQG